MTIVARANYQTLASTNDSDIATSWKSKDANDNEILINENQELLDDWKDQKNSAFHFYGTKFFVVLRDNEEGNFLVCSKGSSVCIARQFKTIWIVVFAEQMGTTAAWNDIRTSMFDQLDAAGV